MKVLYELRGRDTNKVYFTGTEQDAHKFLNKNYNNTDYSKSRRGTTKEKVLPEPMKLKGL